MLVDLKTIEELKNTSEQLNQFQKLPYNTLNIYIIMSFQTVTLFSHKNKRSLFFINWLPVLSLMKLCKQKSTVYQTIVHY